MMEIGPIAVHPEFQRQGLGSKLMDTVEGRSNAGKCTVGLVSCRTDVIPFFEKRGYVVSICAVQCTHFSKKAEKCILHFRIFSKHLRNPSMRLENCTLTTLVKKWSLEMILNGSF